MGGEVIAGDGDALWNGARLDSRAVRGGELFFALEGERTDGHRFVADALGRGAAAAVVHREDAVPRGGDGGAAVLVGDTYRGLHDLVRRLRRELPERLVGITGSVGKTTTKELTAAVLSERFRTARNPGNLNNLYGFPLSFLNIPDDTEVLVAELGMSVPGELAEVSRLARPDGAVLLNVRPAHLENFPDVAAIAEAKAEIFEGLPAAPDAPGGPAWVVANRDDPEVVRVTGRWAEETEAGRRGRVIWFSLGGSADAEVRAQDVEAVAGPGDPGGPAGGSVRFTLEVGGGRGAVELPLHGRYNVPNALAASAVGHALGLGLDEIRRGLAGVQPAAHRGAVHRLPGGTVLIDDSYNSNPEALERALESGLDLRARRGQDAGGRPVAILGDMLELGARAPSFHREAGRRAAALGYAPVVGVGELAGELVAAAREAGAEAIHLEDAEAAADWAAEEVREGDLVLVKGSRGVGLEAVVERLLEAGRGGGDA